jgi:hypothetical protein
VWQKQSRSLKNKVVHSKTKSFTEWAKPTASKQEEFFLLAGRGTVDDAALQIHYSRRNSHVCENNKVVHSVNALQQRMGGIIRFP